MTRLINGRMPEQHAAWNRWHLIIAVLLALMLLFLWLTGRGPGHATADGGCCGALAPAVATDAPPPVDAVATPPAAALGADSDGDGVNDDADRCPNTPVGERVGPRGCPCDVTVQLQYELNSDRLTAEDKVKLDAVAQQLKTLSFESGEVGGYADSTGDEAYNLELSKRRAQSALDYLVTLGVATGQMTAAGYGEANPIGDNATPEGQALNRRAVIRRTDCGPPPHATADAPLPAVKLYFDLDKFDLPADTPGALASIIDYLKGNPSAMATVSGYHDPTGNREHNLELAKQRALAVRDHLIRQGIGEARIEMAKPIETTGTGSLEDARRVEVSVRN